MEQKLNDTDLAADLIWGAKPIANEIGRSERSTYYLLETGRLPAKIIGGKWCASRSGLREHFRAILAAVQAA